MAQRLITFAEVQKRVCISKTHLYRKINSGDFPQPVKLGPMRIAFLESEIDAWINEKVTKRDEGA